MYNQNKVYSGNWANLPITPSEIDGIANFIDNLPKPRTAREQEERDTILKHYFPNAYGTNENSLIER